jgi:hypothetical protein
MQQTFKQLTGVIKMKLKTQGRKNNIVIRRNPEFENDDWMPTKRLTDKMAVEAVMYFKKLNYEVKWLSLSQWDSKNF